MKKLMTAALCAMGAAGASWGYTITPVNLATQYVYKEGGKLVVSGMPNAWSDTAKKEAAFDDDLTTFFDAKPAAGDTYTSAGFQTTVPTIPTKIKYYARGGTDKNRNHIRSSGCRFKAANEPDFSDAMTLHVTPSPTNSKWLGGSGAPIEVSLNDWTAAYGQGRTFTYYRVVGTTAGDYSGGVCCGNFLEIEIYGVTEYPAATEAPGDPTDLATGMYVNGRVSYLFNASAPADAYALRFERRIAGMDEWTVAGGLSPFSGNATLQWSDPSRIDTDCEYRIVAINAAGDEVIPAT